MLRVVKFGMSNQGQGVRERFERVEIVSECFANYYFASVLAQELRERTDWRIGKLRHSHKHGRDRIVGDLMKRSSRGTLTIAVIDYEKGIARKFIDYNFELREVVKGVFVGRAKRRDDVLVIVFDPRIEDVLICRFSRELCRNIDALKRIKSERAYSIVSRVIGKSEVKKIIYELSEAIIAMVLSSNRKC